MPPRTTRTETLGMFTKRRENVAAVQSYQWHVLNKSGELAHGGGEGWSTPAATWSSAHSRTRLAR